MQADQLSPLTRKFVDAFYIEAMVLADEARTYFDETSHPERDRLLPQPRVLFSCEALNVTTRLLYCVTWLLTARAGNPGHIDRLGVVQESDATTIASLPDEAQALIVASEELYSRVARLARQLRAVPIHSPVGSLMSQLSAAF